MKESELIEEGFQLVEVPIIESDNEKDYYYYKLELNDNFILVSDANDEVHSDIWKVHCYEIDITIRDVEDLQTLVALHSKWKKNK